MDTAEMLVAIAKIYSALPMPTQIVDAAGTVSVLVFALVVKTLIKK